MTSIRILVDNLHAGELRGEHGFSALVETDNGMVLWDTGQSDAIAQNADALGVPLEMLDTIALSHGHYDHTGGLVDVLKRANGADIYAHPGIFFERYRPGENNSEVRNIGMPFERSTLEILGARFSLTREGTEIVPGICTTGEIPRIHPFEGGPSGFYLDSNCTRPDPIHDDQSLVIETGSGLAVLFGCCHAGVVNTLESISERWGTREFALVAGGMHLLKADSDRIARTLEGLGAFSIKSIRPGHCTGSSATEALIRAYPATALPLHTGALILL